MKRISIIFLFMSMVFGSMKAQSQQTYRDVGLLIEMSNNPNWGYGEPVVTYVEPYSAADKAGLKRGDIIMEINGSATYLRDLATVANWLTQGVDSEINLTMRNVNTYFKEVPLQGNLKRTNSLSESDLASKFAFYSLENTNDRTFTLPLKVDPNSDVDFSDFHTFDFIDDNANDVELDSYINSQVEKALIARGLVRSPSNPDMLVQSYYSYQPNIKYNTSSRAKNQKTWRYDMENQAMVQVPFLSPEDPNHQTKGQYILELGIRLFDNREESEDGKMTQIWDGKTSEYLTEAYDIKEYARIHTPLMLLKYPYSAPQTNVKYIVSFKKNNYTGLNFDSKDLKTITSVDKNSPADLAGIQKGDVVQKINNTSFKYNKEEMENGYNRFIIESMPLRNPKTRFIDANGFPDCMYWSPNRYKEVSDLFKKESYYVPAFSYLYDFQKYVSTTPARTLNIEVKSGGRKKSVQVIPEQRSSIDVKAL